MSVWCHIRDIKTGHDEYMRIFTYIRIATHIIGAVAIVLLRFPFVGQATKYALIQQWSKQLLVILRVDLTVNLHGELPSSGYLLVGNHISWLDIHVINAFSPVRFVAKSEVASWPIFGWLADQLNTLYVKRESNGEAKKIVHLVANALKNGEHVCVFPEGTSSDGSAVLEFKSNLFQASIDANVPCIPVGFDYRESHSGLRTDTAAFIGDMGLLESISRIVRAPRMTAILNLQGEGVCGDDRKSLAKQAQICVEKLRNG